MSHGSLQSKLPQNNMIAIMFISGWGHYQDLAILVGGSIAHRVLERCIDYCSNNLRQYVSAVERIAATDSFNPDHRDGVSDIIMRLALDVYSAAYDHCLFEMGPRDLPYQLGHIGPMKLYLQRVELR